MTLRLQSRTFELLSYVCHLLVDALLFELSDPTCS